MAQTKSLEYYLAQARRISEHREAGAEKEIRKLYKEMLKDLQQFVSDVYMQYSKDDTLTYAMLQEAGYNARFLEEIEQRLNISTPKAAQKVQALVEETYKLAYDGMVDGVVRASGGVDAAFAESIAITPEQIKRAVENPVSGLTLKDTLEKHRKDIIYSIKQTVGVGLMNGERYTTMARRIAEQVDGDYKKAIRIARTETHRVREGGNTDAAQSVDKELQNGTTGMRMCKTWRTMKDECVRPQRRRRGKKGWSTKMGRGPNHMILDGQTVLADEDFDLQDGNTAPAPGSSGVAGHDINCRCYVSYEMMTDAEFFAKTGKHFPGWNGIENSENGGTIVVDEGMYPPELGGAKRGTQMTFEEADSMHVNPNYGMQGYSTNCQSCVVCFEARQRGYDVYTVANTRGSMPEMLARNTNLAWIDPATGNNPDYITDRTKAYTARSYYKYLDGIIEQGNRYTLQFGWKGRGNGGHIVNLDRTPDGKLRIKDNQRGLREVRRLVNGKYITDFVEEQSEWIGESDVLKYLGQFKYKMTSYGHTFYMTPKVLRIDNMQFDVDVVNQILKAVSKK